VPDSNFPRPMSTVKILEVMLMFVLNFANYFFDNAQNKS
jgi:hypothetical protein